MNRLDRKFFLATALLAGTMVAAHYADRRTPEYLHFPLTSIPNNIAGWHKVSDEEFDARTISKLAPTSYLASRYQRGDEQLDVLIAFYAQQRAGESMHSPKHCLPGSGWEIWKQDVARVPIKGDSVRINKYSIQNGMNRRLVYYWYQSRNRVIASEYLGKVLLVRDALFDGRTAASIVRVILPDRAGADQDGIEFSARLLTEVQRCFGEKAVPPGV
jgi:EpsI family protein